LFTAQAWLPFELGGCESSYSTLHGGFDESKLGSAHHGGDDRVDTHECMLERGGAVVIDDLTVVTRCYETCLILMYVRI
jgi:hypothetical protein